jgi:hypothetical protein
VLNSSELLFRSRAKRTSRDWGLLPRKSRLGIARLKSRVRENSSRRSANAALDSHECRDECKAPRLPCNRVKRCVHPPAFAWAILLCPAWERVRRQQSRRRKLREPVAPVSPNRQKIWSVHHAAQINIVAEVAAVDRLISIGIDLVSVWNPC